MPIFLAIPVVMLIIAFGLTMYFFLGNVFYVVVNCVLDFRCYGHWCELGEGIKNLHEIAPTFALIIWPISFVIWLVCAMFYIPYFLTSSLFDFKDI